MRDIHMSTGRLVEQVKEGYDSDLRYCFILGSGASYTSNIPTGLDLMSEWHRYLTSKGMEYIKECAKDCGISEDKLKRIFKSDYQFQSDDYFTLFDLRFAGMPVVAYRYLQELMENAEPSIGYYMLAVLMDNTENKLVITTNFDSLVEDVLYMYHAKHPLVAGHESLAPFIGTVENMGRPVVAKVHRDLNLHPLNREKELKKLAKNWAESLHIAFSKYIPIVIGYAGGDQTLMNLLEKTNLDSIYWCSLNDSESERIEKLLQGCPRGYLVKIKGFDDVMFRLVSKMTEGKGFDKPVERMKNLFQTRIANYNKQYLDIEHKFTEEETARSSEKSLLSKDLEERDDTSYAPENDISVSDIKDTSAESELDLLDKMASTDNSPAMNVAALRRAAMKSYFDGDFDHALEYCDEAIAIQPEVADLHFLKSNFLSGAHRYKEALEEKYKAAHLDPENAEYHSSLGITLHTLGRYKEALEEKYMAAHLDPENAEYHSSVGITLHKLGRYRGALEEKYKAVHLNPENAEYHYSVGITLHKLGWYKEALDEKEEAVSLDPYNARYHDSRGTTLHKIGLYEEALKESDKAVSLDPNDAMYHDNRGTTLHKLGLYEEALEESNKSIRLNSYQAGYHDNRSATLHELGRYEEALEESNEAVRLDPNNARYHDSRGMTLFKLGRNAEALEEINEANRLDPDNTRYDSGRKKT